MDQLWVSTIERVLLDFSDRAHRSHQVLAGLTVRLSPIPHPFDELSGQPIREGVIVFEAHPHGEALELNLVGYPLVASEFEGLFVGDVVGSLRSQLLFYHLPLGCRVSDPSLHLIFLRVLVCQLTVEGCE